jgi:uncharacterized protein YuzE
MYKTKMNYFEKDDVIHLEVSQDEEVGSVEISPNITAELNKDGDIIGIEILNASSFLRDSILDTAQAKILELKH